MKDGKNRQEQNKNKIPKNIALLYTTNRHRHITIDTWNYTCNNTLALLIINYYVIMVIGCTSSLHAHSVIFITRII